MSVEQPDWYLQGRGLTPQLLWSFSTEGSLIGLEAARESGELLAADDTGSIYLVDRKGRFQFVSHQFRNVRAVVFADTGDFFVVLIGETMIGFYTRKGEELWSLDLPEVCLQIALDPRGDYLLICLVDGRNLIIDRNKNTISRFETVRPLAFARFLIESPEFVAAAEYGLICRHELDGTQVWADKTWSNIGDISIVGSGDAIWVAGYNHGLQLYDSNGNNRASLVTEGTINRVSVSYQAERIAASTIEQHLFWLDGDGELVWGANTREDIRRVIADPLGKRMYCGLNQGRIICLEWSAES